MYVQSWSLRRLRALIGGKVAFVVGLIAFVAMAWLVERGLGLKTPVAFGPVLALVIAGVPAALWLGFFYLWDRHEPEPKHFVAGVFVLGILVAGPLADFLLAQAVPSIGLEQIGGPWALDQIVYSVFVVGIAQEICKYAAVRYTIYLSDEFDEPMDGVLYMMAVGTGFAVWVNYHRLSGQGHKAFLATGAASVVITTLAHASFAGALGYVMGRIKFSRRSATFRGVMLFIGLLAAAGLNGQFALVEAWISNAGMAQRPWRGMIYAAGVAIAAFVLLMFAAQRLLRESPFRKENV